MSTLIDDRSLPSLRQRIGALLGSCTRADIAVGHIRLAALDLTEPETRHVERCRILLGRLEVRSLVDFGPDDDAATSRLSELLRFLESGRVEVRSAGIGAWTPDFSVYRGAPDGDACLIGSHYFREPAVEGATFTTFLTDAASVALALERFGELWQRSHDVYEPVLTAVARRQSFHDG
jgi:hypothetical protein